MKFVKVMNSTRITKAILGLVILILTIETTAAQQIPGNLPIPGSIPSQIPSNIPQNVPQNRPATAIEGEDARMIELTEGEEAELTHEDSVRIALEQEESEDLALTALRRRIYGYKLFNQSNLNATFSLNIPTPNNYVLGPNDQLVIDIYGYSEDHQEVTIDPDGNITIPRSGLLKVGGLDIETAKEVIYSRLKKRFIGLGSNTFLNVSLGNVRSIKVNVIGEVIAPGTYTLTSFASILNALYASGGPNEIGSYRQVNLIRNNKVFKTLDLYDILINGFSNDNILLKDQDVIQVPPLQSRVAVSGFVNRQGLFEMNKDETLEQLVTFAGGFHRDAYTQRVKVYRNTTRERKILDIVNADFSTLKIENGDSLVVERILERFENLVTIEGAVFRPGEYSLSSNGTLLQLLSSAEGIREDALTGRITIVRTLDDLSLENFSVNLKDLKSGAAQDFELRRLDQVIVPSIFELTEEASITITGAINNPDAAEGVVIPFIKNMTLEDVLIRVGGLTEAASLNRVEIVRRKRNVDPSVSNAQISDIITVDITPNYSVLKGSSNPILQPYDQITVRTSPNYQEQTSVELQGEVLYPGTYGIETKEERVSDVITRAGGITLQAYLEGATLLRTIELSEIELEMKRRTLNDIASSGSDNQIIEVEEVEPTQQQSIDIDLKKIMSNPGSVDDLMLRDGDIIRIPTLLETIRIQGEVLYPNTVKYKKANTFKDYISGAGGFTKQSLRKRSYVVYANGSVDRTRKFMFFNVYPKVKPGSEIIVPQRSTNAEDQLARLSSVLATVSASLGTVVTIFGLIRFTGS